MGQLQARVQSKQATPFFIDKLDSLVSHIEEAMKAPNLSPSQQFILARDQAYFKAVFFSGDRPSDMGQVLTPEILRFPNNDGLLFNHVWGKTLREGGSNLFGIRPNPQAGICLVWGIQQSMEVVEWLRINLRSGYLFRPTNARLPNRGLKNT